MEESVMEINGKEMTRESVETWLKGKHVTLWADWIVTDPKRREQAIDWFMREVKAYASA